MGGSPQSSAIFGQLLILSVTHKIIVALWQLVFPSTTHLLQCPFVPTCRTKVNAGAYGAGANNKHLQVRQHLSLDDYFSTGPWDVCQTPDWNVNLAKGLLIRNRLPFIKRVDLLPLCTTKRQYLTKVAFWKDIYKKVVLEVRSKLKPQKKKRQTCSFQLLQ